MAELIIHTERIKDNIKYLSNYFEKKGVHWSLITKVFSGDQTFLKNILTAEVISKISSVGDSRLSSLKNLRAVNPELKTIYIKPPAAVYADEVVKYATVSLNSSYSTIKALNDAAAKAGMVHQIIIMIEMGDLREGVNKTDTVDFYQRTFDLPNIKVIGIGSNLGCMYGVQPSVEKLEELSQVKADIKKTHGVDLPYISGGTSITLPMLEEGETPKDLNHYRIGEAAFFGITPLHGARFKELSADTFEFKTNIIELEEKRLVPEGTISEANIGTVVGFEGSSEQDRSHKAILDFGLIDVDQNDLSPHEKDDIKLVGTTSDMTVVDIGENLLDAKTRKYKVGDTILLKTNYMGVARLLNSKFVTKVYQ